MDLENARVAFDALQKKICAFNHATALIYFDGETSAPPDTIDNRTQTLQILNEEIFKLRTGDETMELLGFLDENRNLLSVRERRAVDFMLRDSKKKSSIPAKEYVQYENLLAEAQDAWHRAREEGNFEILSPYLEDVFDTVRRFAAYCGYEDNPYDCCLDNYEEGLDTKTCEELFDAVRSELTPLLHAITEKPQIDDSCIKGDFSAEDQENLAIYLMELIGLNLSRVGLATSEHPFTTFLGSHFDERIATRYSRKDFTTSLYTVLFEGGHVLYDMGQADNLAYTVLDGGVSMGLLESQGRFYENFVGRSRNFINYIFPEIVDLFPETLSNYTSEDLYRAVNKVEPGLIRIDADELTFNIHVMIRYELERAILNRELEVKDLPEAWNKKYKDYLGIDVTDNVNGVLQDIHWPFGAIGYFPAYVLGNAYVAQITNKMREDIDLEECIDEGNFKLINLWNKEHIWKHGGLYKAKEIMEKYVGVEFSPDAYISYIKDKYTDIYNL